MIRYIYLSVFLCSSLVTCSVVSLPGAALYKNDAACMAIQRLLTDPLLEESPPSVHIHMALHELYKYILVTPLHKELLQSLMKKIQVHRERFNAAHTVEYDKQYKINLLDGVSVGFAYLFISCSTFLTVSSFKLVGVIALGSTLLLAYTAKNLAEKASDILETVTVFNALEKMIKARIQEYEEHEKSLSLRKP